MLSNLHFVLKMIDQLSEAEQLEAHLILRDKYVYRIPFPLPGQRLSATPGRFAFATSKPSPTCSRRN